MNKNKNKNKNMTLTMIKKMQKHWDDYIRTLSVKGTQYPSDCYKNPSQAKWKAFNNIYTICKEIGGHHLSIISYSIHSFTTGYITKDEFICDTKDNTFNVELTDYMKQQLKDIGVII